MGDLCHESLRIRDETDQALLDFIRTALDLCFVFAKVVVTAYSMGHRAHAEQTIASAEKGYSDMIRYFLRARGMTPKVEMELRLTFKRLRERLDGLQRLT